MTIQPKHILSTLLASFIIAFTHSSCVSPSKRKYMESLLTKAEEMNSHYLPMDSAVFMDTVVNFYNSHGTMEERIRANYMKGCVHRDQGDSPMALEYYMKAVSLADTTSNSCNYELLGRIYAQMAIVFDKQRHPEKSIEMWNAAMAMAEKNKDTLLCIQCIANSAGAYDIEGERDKARKAIADSYTLYKKIGRNDYAAGLMTIMASYDLECDSLVNAKQKLDKYTSDSGLVDKNGNINPSCALFYYILGQYYTKTNALDSAMFCYRKLLDYNEDIINLEYGYKGLMNVFKTLHQVDSIVKYAELYANANDSANIKNSADEVSRVKALFDYSKHKDEAIAKAEETNTLWRALFFILVLVVICSIGIYMFIKKRTEMSRKKINEANARYKMIKADYDNAVADYDKYKADKTAFEHDMQDKIKNLQEALSTYKDSFSMDKLPIEQKLHHHQIVETFHGYAAKGQTPTEKDWDVLHTVVEKQMSAFLEAMERKEYNPSEQELRLCVLTRLGFSSSEVFVLMNLTKQRVSNMRSRLNEKLFNQSGTTTFKTHIYKL